MDPEVLRRKQEAFVHANLCTQTLVDLVAEYQLRVEPEWYASWLARRLRDYEGFILPGTHDGQYLTLETSTVTRDDGDFVITTSGVMDNYAGERNRIAFVPLRIEVARGAGDYALVTVWVRNFVELVIDLLRKLMLATLKHWPEAATVLEIHKHTRHYMVDAGTWSQWVGTIDALEAELREASLKGGAKTTVPDEATPAPGGSLGTPETAQKPEIRVPKQATSLHRWRLTWRLVRAKWEQGLNYEELSTWLDKMHPNLPHSPETLRDIIIAGEAGLLSK